LISSGCSRAGLRPSLADWSRGGYYGSAASMTTRYGKRNHRKKWRDISGRIPCVCGLSPALQLIDGMVLWFGQTGKICWDLIRVGINPTPTTICWDLIRVGINPTPTTICRDLIRVGINPAPTTICRDLIRVGINLTPATICRDLIRVGINPTPATICRDLIRVGINPAPTTICRDLIRVDPAKSATYANLHR